MMPLKIRKIFMILFVTTWGVACQDFSIFDCFNQVDGCQIDEVDFAGMAPVGSDDHQSSEPEVGSREEGSSWEEGRDMAMLGSNPEVIPNCNPEEPMLACQECSDGEWVNNDNDQLCAEVDCTRQNQYVLEEREGEKICQKIDYLPKANYCERGACLTGTNACVEVSRRVIARSTDLGECQSLEGCRGERPPEVINNTGRSCRGGEGLCDEHGDCMQIGPPCPMEGDYFKLCSDTQSEDFSCTFGVNLLLSTGWYSYVDCNDFCQSISGSCTESWNASDYRQCLKGRPISCRARIGDVMCRCVFMN